MNPLIDRQGDLNLAECRFDALGISVAKSQTTSPDKCCGFCSARKSHSDKGRKLMAAMSRRVILTNIVPGAVVAIAGVGTIGWAVAPEVADAMPLAIAKGNHAKVDDLVEKAQAVV